MFTQLLNIQQLTKFNKKLKNLLTSNSQKKMDQKKRCRTRRGF